MIDHCGLDAESRFLDVGSGLGKPSFHVAQYPGVSFAFGIETVRSRYLQSIASLRAVLVAACKQTCQEVGDGETTPEHSRIRGNKLFMCGTISSVKTFHPFTHVYVQRRLPRLVVGKTGRDLEQKQDF